MKEYEKYKMDKLIEYLKFTISAHLVAIGVVATFKEKFLSSSEINITFVITIATLLVSFCAAMLGYMHLIGSFFEQPKHNKAIARFARKYSGALLMASVLSFFLQSMPWG
ncbi:hypothetical protein ACPFUG_003372 [Vibrio cholerae]